VANLLVRKLNDRVKARLRLRAAQHGRSMEEEARVILTSAVAEKSEKPRNLAEAVHRRFARLGGIELELLPRTPVREPPDFQD
jgi:plasmid stability protein